MPHQVVYRKYRSKDFSELIGQSHIATTISNQIKCNSIGHAYLFFGPRGTGKTSTARIFAKTVNCLTPQIIDQYLLPCNNCDSCNSFSTDEIDILELDAASNRGIDDARLLKEKVLAQPMSHKYKVIILDEAHMLTREAVNALLKIIEEPPKYVIFIFCTTEFNKIPITIASRCQRFKFLLASRSDVVEKLKKICKQENKVISEDKLNVIAKLSKGSFRDAESLLEQVLYSGDSYINELFSLYENTELFDKFINSLMQPDLIDIWNILCRFEESQQGDFKQFLDLVLDYAQDKYDNKVLEFDIYLKIIKLVGAFRGDTKEELIYKLSQITGIGHGPLISNNNNFGQSDNKSLINVEKSNINIKTNNTQDKLDGINHSSNSSLVDNKISKTLSNENNSDGILNETTFLNLFKDKVGIFNLLLKANIKILDNKVIINVNSTVSKLFLQKNNLLIIVKPNYPLISDVSINVVKSNSDSIENNVVQKSNGSSKINEIEDIFKSKFQ